MLNMTIDKNMQSILDRRKYMRHNEGVLELCIRRKGLLHSFSKRESVEWLNFNEFGLAFSCDTHFDINETILIDFKTPPNCLHDIVAIIHNARRQAGKFRYGVQFYFGANSYMRSTEVREKLLAIEESLN